ncbi:MAG: DUF4890 domain-containing protein [Prevotella sp.]|nr:DUF4890 domain-containing protein [Prevotella sp.]
MKKIVLMMVALLSMTAVQAQENDNNQNPQQFRGPRQMTPEQMTERMSNDLKLTDDQKTKVLALNKEYEKVIAGPGMRGPRPGRGNGEAQNGQQRPERPQFTEEQREEMKQRMEKRQEYEKKLKEILTEEQYKQYQKSRPGRRGFGRGFGGGRPGGPGHNGGPRAQF